MKKRFHATISTDAKPPYPVDLGVIVAGSWYTAAFRAVREFIRGKGRKKQHGEIRLTLRYLGTEEKS